MNLIDSILFSDRVPKLASRSLDFQTQKVAITASNIANAETPGYKAVRVNFDKVLQDASGGNMIAMKITNGKHISSNMPDIKSLQPNVVVDQSAGRIDGNNVNLEREMITLSQAKLAYDAAISAMGKRGSIIKSALTETR